MHKKYLSFFLAGVAMLAVLGAACGDDDDDDGDATETETEEDTATEEESATEDATGEATEDATEDATEEPGGEIVELSDNPTQGVSDSEVTIGTHYPLSGPVAIYAPISAAITAYLDSVGEINGRTINFIIRDDAYTPPQTVEVTNQLIEQDQVFAILNGLGTPTHSQVFESLAEQGVPDLLIASGAAIWTNPLVPTAFAANGNYIAEGRSFGAYAAEQGFASVAIIYQNDDFGNEGREGFLETAEGIEVTSEQTYEANARDLTSQTINAIADDPELLYIFATPVETGSAIKAARDNGFEGQIVISTVAATDFLGLLTGTPENLTDTVTAAGFKLLSQSDDPDVQAHVALMEAAGITATNFTIYGQSVAEVFVEALTLAGPELTRGALIAAFETIQDFTCSLCIGPVNMGADDHRAFETFIFVTFDGTAFVPLEGAEPVSDEGN